MLSISIVFILYKMFGFFILVGIICKTNGSFEEISFDILHDTKVKNFTEDYSEISVIQCAAKCMTKARESTCEQAGYNRSSRTCHLASNTETVPDTLGNAIVLRPIRGCDKTLEMDFDHVTAEYPSGTVVGATATVTCDTGHRSDSGLKSWTFKCVAGVKSTWESSSPPDCTWELLFRGTAGNGYNVTNAYLFGNIEDGVTEEENCKDVYNADCALNYRNPKVDEWTTLEIKEVSYELYNSTDAVMIVRFDGVGSSINSWFSTSTVISHPWNIASDTVAWWDLNGPSDIAYGRSFRVTLGYYYNATACADHYYTVIFYPPGWACSYEDHPAYPRFTYSNSPSGSRYDTEPFQSAGTMGIWVKYL